MAAATSRRAHLRSWWIAARIHTLPAGIAPVILGVGLAAADGMFALYPAVAALIGAVLIQIGTNFANDYSDARRGVDRPDRAGFTRVTASGMLAPSTVRRAMIIAFAAAILVGTYLVYVGGLPIVIIGLSSILFGYLYTGGPSPYGYRGLGDLFVFVYFGLIAVVGTYYVQAADTLAEPLTIGVPTGTVTPEAVLGGIAMGALTTAILVINNLRDLEDDRDAGKRTLAVILGTRWTRIEFTALLVAAYLVPVYFVLDGAVAVAAAYLSLPLAALVLRTVLRTREGEAMNRALASTGRLTLVYAVLFALGVWW